MGPGGGGSTGGAGREGVGGDWGGEAAFGASPVAFLSGVGRGERFENIARFVRLKLGDDRHERRVAELATVLFGATRGWHGLGRGDLVALRFAALLHDIGRWQDDEKHPEIGCNLILRSKGLPLVPRERRLAAYVARYHRGAVSAEGMDLILRPGEFGVATRILGLLRAADGLDSRVTGRVEVDIAGRGRKLLIVARLGEEGAKARRAVGRRKKFRLLESVMGCEVRVRVV